MFILDLFLHLLMQNGLVLHFLNKLEIIIILNAKQLYYIGVYYYIIPRNPFSSLSSISIWVSFQTSSLNLPVPPFLFFRLSMITRMAMDFKSFPCFDLSHPSLVKNGHVERSEARSLVLGLIFLIIVDYCFSSLLLLWKSYLEIFFLSRKVT